MEFINWLYTPEGMMTTLNGPEGLTWEMKDGKAALTDFGKKAMRDSSAAGTCRVRRRHVQGRRCANQQLDTEVDDNEPEYGRAVRLEYVVVCAEGKSEPG